MCPLIGNSQGNANVPKGKPFLFVQAPGGTAGKARSLRLITGGMLTRGYLPLTGWGTNAALSAAGSRTASAMLAGPDSRRDHACALAAPQGC
jgi:hypothetical protein